MAHHDTPATSDPTARMADAAPPDAGGAALPGDFATAALARTMPLYVADLDGRIRYANDLFRELADMLDWPADTPAIPVADVLEADATGTGAVRREHSNGQRIVCTSRHEVLRGTDGGRLGVLATFERRERRLNADTKSTRQRLADIVRLATDWIWETDRNLRFTFLSPRVTDLLGYHPMELVGATWDAIAADSAPFTVDPEAGRIPTLADRDLRLCHRDGGVREVRISAVPIFDGETFAGYRGAARDVTDLRSREAALQEAKERAEQADRAKSLFLAQMSHELRTPLNAVIGFSDIIAQEALGPAGVPAYREYAGDILASGHHLLAIIDDVLDVSKIESGTFRLSEDLAEANALMAEARRMVDGQGAGRNVTIRGHLVTPDVCLEIDVARIRQVLVNLISNAAKYSDAGSTVDVTGELGADGGFTFRVSDAGPGMRDDEIALALQPFGQVDTTMARRHGGIGLGLPLAQRLLAQHGGELLVDSAPGEGTTVAAVLPPHRVNMPDPGAEA